MQYLIDPKNNQSLNSLISDYVNCSEKLKDWYEYAPKISNFDLVIKNRVKYKVDRKVLVRVLNQQYRDLNRNTITEKNIESLIQETTFTVTTGHQPILCLGPAYFLYKIIDCIQLCRILKKKYTKYHFVPLFWIASEDNDIGEINQFNFSGNVIKSEVGEAKGAVGRMQLKGLDEFFKNQMKEDDGKKSILDLFRKNYDSKYSFSEACFNLLNDLFGKYGLVVLDADNKDLKKVFSSYIKKDILFKENFKHIKKTSSQIKEKGYKPQLNPREINFFYLRDNLRERIVFENQIYKVLNTEVKFSKQELIEEIDQFPERFSPNAALRTLYQEVVLPNLVYIGGGGELSYWLQLKNMFEYNQVFYPMLLLRRSFFFLKENILQLLEIVKKTPLDFFLSQESIIQEYIKNNKEAIDIEVYKNNFELLFKQLKEATKDINRYLSSKLEASENNINNEWKVLRKAVFKAYKIKYESDINKIKKVKSLLFPKNILQERYIGSLYLLLENADVTFLEEITNVYKFEHL